MNTKEIEVFASIKKQKILKRVLLTAIIVACIILAPIAIRHLVQKIRSKSKKNIIQIQSPDRRSFVSIEGFSFIEDLDQKTQFKIFAQKADIRNRKIGFFRIALQKIMEMEDVLITIYDENKEISTISSDRATVIMGKNDTIFTGNVVFSSKNGKNLKTDKMIWDNGKKILKTDHNYVYTANGEPIKKGKGFKTDPLMETIVFLILKNK